MASVPNRVYPMNEYREIIADKLTVVSGSFSTRVSAPYLVLSTTNSAIPSGSMYPGYIALVTGSDGTSATLYFCVRSGSGEAIYSVAGTYVSTGSHY